MTSTLPAQADHGANSPVLGLLNVGAAGAAGTPLLEDGTAGLSDAQKDAGVTDLCDQTDYTCAITLDTDTDEVLVRAYAGDPTQDAVDGQHPVQDNSTTWLVKLGVRDFPNTVGTDATNGLTVPLDFGNNVLSIDVIKKSDPNTSRRYTLTITRTENSRPAFEASGKNDRYVYGYAQDLMEHQSGHNKTGTASVYNHPSDGGTVDLTADPITGHWLKNDSTKRFVKTGTEFTTTAISTGNDQSTHTVLGYMSIINAGVSPEGTNSSTADYLKDTSGLNLVNGILMTANQPLGSIRLPMATGGNGDIKDYELAMYAADGNEVDDLPTGLTANYAVWTDDDTDTLNPDGTDGNNDGDTGVVGQIDDNEVACSAAIDNDLDAPANTIGICLVGTPLTDSNNRAERSVHSLIYRAVDDDDDTKSSDAAEIAFSITIQKALVTSPTPGDPDTPEKNELTALTVTAVTTAVTAAGNTPREAWTVDITPEKFDSDVTTYRVRIPYESEGVNITATAFSGSKLKELSSNSRVTSALAFPVTELSEGSNAPVQIEVTPPDDSGLDKKTYTIILSRDYNTPAQFDTSEKPADLNYYDGVAIEPVDLPGGRLGNGDPTPSATAYAGEWRYDLSLEDEYTGRGTPGHPYVSGSQSNDNYASNKRTQATTTWLPSPPAFGLSVSWDSKTKTVSRQLVGTPNLGPGTDAGRSKYSDYKMLYVAKDGDLDDSAADNAEYKFNIRVWRNVLLNTLKIDTTPGTDALTDTVFDRTNDNTDQATLDKYSEWNADRKYEYSYTVDHDVDQIVVVGTPMDSTSIGTANVVVTSPKDADKDTTTRHEVNLVDGNNPITIEVTNGENVGTHELTVYRRPLGANPITVTALAGDEKIELSPDFHVESLEYTGTVESHQSILYIEVETTHPSAQVSIEYIATGRSKAKEVDADTGMNRYRIDVTLGSATTTYYLNITRKGNATPSFGSATISDTTHKVGRAIMSCETDGTENAFVLLPEGDTTSGNGALSYSIDSTTLPDGLKFDPLTRKLTGTPVLREAYERSYDIAYVVNDGDTDRSAADTDTINFTLTITNADVDKCGMPGGTDPIAKNLLTDLLVIYDLASLNKSDIEAALTPEFDSSELSYTVELPHGASNRRIAAYVQAGASVSLNKVRIAHGEHTPLREDSNTVRVSYNGLPSTNYSLSVTVTPQSIPSFTESVPDQTYQTGVAITPFALPVATGGNTPPALTYSLADHRGAMPTGLVFDAATRTLSGTPSLSNVDAADNAIYKMTYTVMDRDGDKDTDTFNITVQTDPVDTPNTGVKPMDLKVSRSGTSATVSWNAGDAAAMQYVLAHKMTSDIPALLASLQFMVVGAGVETHTLTNLESGTYQFIVVGEDASGMIEDADGNLYDARTTQ